MQSDPFYHFMQSLESPLPMSELLAILDPSQPHCLFVKDESSNYCYANHNYIQFMGLQNIQQLRQLNDYDISKNKAEVKKYRDHDSQVIEEGSTLRVSELISPQYNQPIEKTMEGAIYPLFKDKARAQYVLGIVTPKCKLLKLDFDTLFKLTPKELLELLVKRSYTIHLPFGSITLSKMEIRTIIQMIKGDHAGDIAKALSIKQTTVESYLTNIKNKLAVDSKSELIRLVLSGRILEQIAI
ncbi:MAG: helix-turn-helix transcriptional regulator [Gammaproteobacteria bacterium]|nr:helix-turn-helix transcriptional regulator [Gammaproteobacteria bacterium]